VKFAVAVVLLAESEMPREAPANPGADTLTVNPANASPESE
jgi:hypothetical protein